MLNEATPLEIIHAPLLDQKGISLFVKRDDLIHPFVQGNKWRKLKYNLEKATKQGHDTLLTFGGAFSNHIYATAAAAQMFGFKSIGIIRGEKPEQLSSTLKFAVENGMQLHFLDRQSYRNKDAAGAPHQFEKQFGNFYLIPEGGTNIFALKGVAEVISEINKPFDVICTPTGTGGTLAGLVAALKGEKQVLGFCSLKGEDTLTNRVHELTNEYSSTTFHNYQINFDYHLGGYAKMTAALFQFICDFQMHHKILLDPVYTGKMFFGLFDLIAKDYFPRGTSIIALHTGGLQGWNGFKEKIS